MSTLTPQQFVANWSNTQLKESASYTTHFDDLCELVGHAKPAHADKTGATFTYQKGALKSDGGQIIGHGFADVWFKDHFAIEYKGAGQHKTLTEALKQLRGYAGSLEIRTVGGVRHRAPMKITAQLQRCSEDEGLQHSPMLRTWPARMICPRRTSQLFKMVHHLFHNPELLRPQSTIADVTETAARRFADLSESIHKQNPQLDTRQVARFLMKMMFCLFCEDVGLLPKNLLARIVEKTKDNRGKFTRSLRDLFQAMATGGDMWGEDIPLL